MIYPDQDGIAAIDNGIIADLHTGTRGDHYIVFFYLWKISLVVRRLYAQMVAGCIIDLPDYSGQGLLTGMLFLFFREQEHGREQHQDQSAIN